MKLLHYLLAAVTAAISISANASVITVGALTRDTTSPTIVDSMNNRVWLGFDVTRGLTYEQTVAAIGSGGVFEDYRIARNGDAMLFANAMAGGLNPCSTGLSETCLTGSQDAENVFGESYFNQRATGNVHDFDYVWFLSDNGIGADVGLFEVFTHDTLSNDRVRVIHEWNSITGANSYTNTNYSIGWLLYRDTSNAVPEPGSIALLGVGLLAAAGASRRRKKEGRQ